MNELPAITLLTVGGTIAMTGEQGSGVVPRLDAGALLGAIPALGALARMQGHAVAQIPSPHMTLNTVITLARAVQGAIANGARGVVITQGTDTLEESAFALELLLPDPGVPVVLTGAMRNPALPGTDGPANLLAAVRVAAAGATGGRAGVVTVMDGQIHAPRFMRKVHTDRVGAFESKPVLLGEVVETRINLFASLPPLPGIAFALDQQAAPVALLTAVMGDDGRLVDSLQAAGYQGLVVAGMGGGHVHPAMAERLAALAAAMPVVVASRTGGGATLTGTYAYSGGEIDLAQRGMLRAGWLSADKTRIALALLLGAGRDLRAIRAFLAAFDNA